IGEHHLRAELLASVGRTKEALQAYDALDIFRAVDPIFLPLAHLGKARIYDKADDRENAIQEYASFVELWKSAEPAERADVEQARARLEQLRVANQRASR
ncbi:MAG TPA: hypothetical protein VL742_03215, partial [Casimicrobiaceae bacterium]|nr:hypothetical protein [Casimicrobiaceae bacterium]